MRQTIFNSLSIRLLMAVFIVQIMACSSGKRLFEKGDYDGAVMKASQRLKQAPNNAKAKNTLRSAYTLALKTHLDAIQMAKNKIYLHSIVCSKNFNEFPPLDNKNFMRMKIPIPPIEIQNNIVDEINEVEAMTQRWKRDIDYLKNKKGNRMLDIINFGNLQTQ